jgi:hypothetical protein
MSILLAPVSNSAAIEIDQRAPLGDGMKRLPMRLGLAFPIVDRGPRGREMGRIGTAIRAGMLSDLVKGERGFVPREFDGLGAREAARQLVGSLSHQSRHHDSRDRLLDPGVERGSTGVNGSLFVRVGHPVSLCVTRSVP